MHNLKITIFYTSVILILLTLVTSLSFINQDLYSLDAVRATRIGLIYVSFVIFVITLVSLRLIEFRKINPNNIILWFIIIYFGLGIFPFSSYRENIINSLWLMLLSISVFVLIMGQYFGKLIARKSSDSYFFQSKENLRKTVFTVFFILSLSFTFIIIYNYGFLLFNPSARFLVPASWSYIAELLVPLTITIFALFFAKGKSDFALYLLFVVSFLLLFSLGYRNQPMLLIIGTLMVIFFKKQRLLKKKISINNSLILSVGLTIILFLFSILFISRQESSSELLNWNDFVEHYEVNNYQVTMPLFPLHLSAREAMGVTTVALDRQNEIDDLLEKKPFFFADLYTLLPGEQLTSGNILGMVVNRNPNVSLTPGLIGGLYLTGKIYGVCIGFFVIGFLISYFWNIYRIQGVKKYLALSIITLIYSIELINRGIFKPMYIVVLILPYLLISIRKEKS